MTYTANDIGANIALLAVNSNATTLANAVAVGFNTTSLNAVVYQGGTATDLPTISGAIPVIVAGSTQVIAIATSITAAGDKIAGASSDSGGVFRPVYWTKVAGVWTLTQLTEPAGHAGQLSYEQGDVSQLFITPFGAYVSADGSTYVAMYGQTLPSVIVSVIAVWTTSTPTTLSLSGNSTHYGSLAVSSNGGVIFAEYQVGATYTPLYFTSGTGPNNLPYTLPNTHQFVEMAAYGANSSGSIGVFSGYDASTENVVGVYYSSGTLVQLAVPSGATNYTGYGVDATAEYFVGGSDQGAVLWSSGTPALIPALSGGTATDGSYAAWSVANNAAIIVGYGNNGSAVLHGIIWTTGVTPSSVNVADTFFAPTAGFVDLTSSANRRKFYSASGGAVSLGANGSLPFGTEPPAFLTSNGTPATFAANNGSGGAFAVTGGSLAASATNPPGSSGTITTYQTNTPAEGVVGDYLTGNLYAYNPDGLTDNGTPRRWLRRWPALPASSEGAKRFATLVIDMQTGIDIAETANPQVVLRWTDDSGRSWQGNRIGAVGQTGQTAANVKFNRLGMTRRYAASDRFLELSSTDAFPVVITNAEVEVE